MSSRQLDEERIFHVARDLSNPATRAEYLDQICAGDQALRERVEALLTGSRTIAGSSCGPASPNQPRRSRALRSPSAPARRSAATG